MDILESSLHLMTDSAAFDWAGSIQSTYTNMWKTTIEVGNESMVPLFENGVFLDMRQIPLLTMEANVTRITQGDVES